MGKGQSKIRSKPLNYGVLVLLAVVVGIVAGLGAAAFRALIGLFHNVFFLGTLSFSYDASEHTPAGPWGPLVILAPVVGGAGVVFLVRRFAPEAKGHGVPEVMEAIYYKGGIIRPVVAAIKAFASALSIGSGGSVGREGPIVQIGASFASTVGQVVSMSVWQRNTLIAAGAGGGIAATFNTPVGGVLFAVELMLPELSARTFVPVAIGVASATVIGRAILGAQPAFIVVALKTYASPVTTPVGYLAFVVLGGLLGLASAAYVRSIYLFEDFFEHRMPGSPYIRHMAGMLLVGLAMYALHVWFGHYFIEGVGYATIQDILTGVARRWDVLLLLFFLKLAAVSLTLGSGASGGVFSPGLFMGATLGGALAIIIGLVAPAKWMDPAVFAMVGMAGMVGGATGAAITSVVMIFEMTYDYGIIVPLVVATAVSNGVRRLLCKQTIYTMKLMRRGQALPDALRADIAGARRAVDVMDTHWSVVQHADIVRSGNDGWFLVEKDGELVGVIRAGSMLAALADKATYGEAADSAYVSVAPTTPMRNVALDMRRAGAATAIVTLDGGLVAPGRILGLVGWLQVADLLDDSSQRFE